MSAAIQDLIGALVADARKKNPDHIPLIGIAGAQGSGKSYQCRQFVAANPRVAHFSLDDVYLTKVEREEMARQVHPLFATRGAPGTHDLDLAQRTISALRSSPPPLEGEGARGWGESSQPVEIGSARPPIAHASLTRLRRSEASASPKREARRSNIAIACAIPPTSFTPTPSPPPSRGRGEFVRLPSFDKARDDRAPENTWPSFTGRHDAILFDGWCLGALPDGLGDKPLNTLEADEDTRGHWRARIRAELAGRYHDFLAAFDAIVYLRPPSWEIVKLWRAEQEVENLGRPLTDQDHARLDRFLMHYERITRSMMAGGHMATVVADLNDARDVISVRHHANPPTSPP